MSSLAISRPWRDRKRYWWMMALIVPALPIASYVGASLSGLSLFWWLGPFLVHVLVPLLDWRRGRDQRNPPEDLTASLEADRYYRLIVMAYIPLQYAATVWSAWVVAQGELSPFALLGLLLTLGTCNGIGINTAHELGHKRESLERWLSKVALAPVAYGHFFVEHNKGHHRRVATPEDPASARLGESFWAFLPRTVWGSLLSAWEIERERLSRLGYGPIHWKNENLQAWGMTVALFGGLCLWLGWTVLPFLLLQAAYGASLLEVVNYIEHYGLKRRMDEKGRYESCKPEHSWNSNQVITNMLLYNLQRHSDHHANPGRRFQALRHFDDSPQLPSGYASMLVLAYCPPIWFRIMDPLVEQHYNGEMTRANLQPGKEKKYL